MKLDLHSSDRINLIKKIVNSERFLGDYKAQEGGIISFLEMIWDLRSMKSNDSRFTNARDDIWKHIVMNDDMTIEDLFLDRLPSTHNNDDIFIKFINTTVHPSVISNESERDEFVDFLNNLFSPFKYKLTIGDYFGDIPVYNLTDKFTSLGMPKGISKNSIPFFFSNNKNITYPCFVLTPDNWNDWFKWTTKFYLEYWPSNQTHEEIGHLKIMKTGEFVTGHVLPNYFLTLDDDFCSVGQSQEFYENMKEYFPDNCHSIFLALRDAAMYPSIRSQFTKDFAFNNSLLRDSEAKQMLDSARFIVNRIDVKSYYKFSYSFIPPFCEQSNEDNTVNIDFDFVYNTNFNQRIYGLIGKNGTGKTTFLSRMANDFAQANPQNIIPQKPLYNKVITISFSFFDKLPLPSANAEFNYSYLGLKYSDEKDINKALGTRLIRFLNTIKWRVKNKMVTLFKLYRALL